MTFRIKGITRCLLPALLALMPLSCAAGRLHKETLTIIRASGEPVALECEIARTEKEQEKGYMGRKSINDGTGMLFAFTADKKMLFWMKDTPHALSIAYIDSEGVIREIHDMTPFSLEVIESERSLRYALEVPQGWFARAGIACGDRLSDESLKVAATPGKQ